MTLSLFVVIRTVANTPLDINLVTLMDILFNDFSQFFPENNIMPIRMVRNLRSVLQGVATLRRSQRHTRYSHSGIHIAYLRILSHITYQHYLIHITQRYLACPR